MRVLLDTNAYSALFRGDDAVAEIVRRAEAVVMSTVVIGELLYGFRHGSRYEKNREQLDRFLSNALVRVVEVTVDTAARFGLLSAALRRKGRPLPTNDIWIAAHSLDASAELISFDSHFEAIDGLLWRRPATSPRLAR